MADVRTPELVINKLSKQQYENIQNPSDTEIYLVPEDEEHKPICYPTTASDVTTTSMLVKSSVSDNGKILTENGFVYNTSGNPTVSDNKVICDLGVGFFEKKLENLTINTEYHIKSYGINASGLVYGSEFVQRTSYNPIPVEYQLVEYLESRGTQHINTGIIPSNGDIIYTDFVFTNLSQTYNFVFGSLQGGNHALTISYIRQTYGIATANTVVCAYDGGGVDNALSFIYNVQANMRYKTFVYFDSSTIYARVNDEPWLNIAKGSTAHSSLPYYVFTRNTNGSASDGSKLIGRILNFKITTDNIDRLNLYPVYRKADSKPGMYDIVNNVFYTNQGTGEFNAGPDKEWGD